MKKSIILTWLVLCITNLSLCAQHTSKALAKQYLRSKGEVIFTFKINHKSQLNTVTKQLAIVHYDDATKTVKVMANKNQFAAFLQKSISFKVAVADNVVGKRTMTSDLAVRATTFPLTAYPTYADYEAMMNAFASNNPTLCKVENIGATTEGDKSLLFVKLSDNVSANEQEPRVMFTSSMHGDEIAGYPMMLNLIDYLLKAYNDATHPRHAEIKFLLDNNEVWINPLANPDGTFRNSPGNTSVANATRGNANNVDLNRNYPDPDDGAHPDGNSYQVETQAFMNFAANKHFVLSANFHGGIELVNYAWDTYAGNHPDKDYFVHISEEYRDHCQVNSPNGYFDDRNNGITNGYAWYEVQGGRQDWQIFYQKGRELTIELSNAKTPAASQLVNYWNYNRDALLGLLNQVNYGIRGVVTDAVTNQPITAKVTVVGKEGYESWVPTELPEGDYYRPIKAGTYSILVEAACYQSVTISGVTIGDQQTIVKNVQLTPIAGAAPTGLASSNVQPNAATLTWVANAASSYDVRYRIAGSSNWATVSSGTASVDISGLTASTQYEAQVRSKCTSGATSAYSASFSFTTPATQACAGINNFPYVESFEGGLGVWSNATNDNIDWIRYSGSTPSNGTGPSGAQNGNYYLYTEASSNASGSPNKVALLNSPCVDLSSFSEARLEFGYHMYGSNMGTLEVLVSTNDGATYTTIWNKSGQVGNAWDNAIVDLSAYAGSVIKLQFKGKTGSSWRSDLAIDNVRISSSVSTPDTQAPTVPANLATTGVTANSVGLTWSVASDNVGVTGYEIYQGGNLLATVNATTYTAAGLAANTSYTFAVKAKDAAGNTSAASNSVDATTLAVTITYCASKGNNVNDEYIGKVQFGSIDNTSGSGNGYTDFTSQITAVAKGSSNPITITPTWIGTVYNEGYSVWIDFNQDGDFTDAGEQVFTQSATKNTPVSGTIAIPSTALSGATRMRVSMKYNGIPTSCENFTYGEVEDYTVNIGSRASARMSGQAMVQFDEVELYPNPMPKGGILQLKSRSTHFAKAVFTVRNATGQTIKQGKVANGQVKVGDLPAGVYFLELYTPKRHTTKRFVVGG
ncbi:M14 family zinc carboxypeptidase [Microscilla marina]|uniref:Carboxypeptidase n=1 Tax=Microscilla marina ATCC 23134 TaxID=313606 RepID=A1ZD36_MICM2|nr:M14 family zinc carboxypeptidase [Microscilla marina]EAY31575.1 carboxypeptidase [Microscilla marina ATCC 23134]